ncbi:MAG: HDOD domain-containing protein [Gammaproteobacteria bacterium]
MANISSEENNRSPTAACSLQPEEITVRLLKHLFPIRNLDDEKLQAFALDKQSEIIPAGTTLFTVNTPVESVLYLIRGVVTISDAAGNSFELNGTMPKAKFPLSTGITHSISAVAKTDISALRVSQKIMQGTPSGPHHRQHLEFPDKLLDSSLIQAFSQHYDEEKLQIPSLPDIAAKLYKAMQEEIGIADAVKIIQLDPVISAKIVQVANCPLYVTSVPAKSCLAAVNRIGMHATRNLVISLSIKQVFKGKSPLIRKYLDRTWKQSIYVSSICFVLASLTRKINPEEALLAGLVSDIGVVPFLNFAADLPPDYCSEQEIESAIPYIRGPVGANILRNWDFPEEFINIPLLAEDWFQHYEDKLTLADIVVLSRLHSKIGTPEMDDLPHISSIPASGKLEDGTLSPDHSLRILHTAKHKINEAIRIFSS